MGGKTKDLTVGSPIRLILGFAIPMLLGMLFQQFYSMVDTIIVGKSLGVKELAGVGATGSVNFMVIGFCNGVCSGFALPIAQCFGAGDYRGMRRYMTNSIWISVAFAAVITFFASIFCRQILEMMNTPEDIIDLAYDYIYIIFLGIPTTFLYNLMAGVIRSLGNSRTPVMILIVAAMINIILDLFFVVLCKMGVDGAALATVISQLVSGIACIEYIRRNEEILHPRSDEWGVDGHIVRKLCTMGIPMGLQYSITAIGGIVLQTAVNSLGSASVAAMTAAGRINGFAACPFDALGSTMATYAGQNLGARRPDRVREGVLKSTMIGAVYSVLAAFVLIFFGRNLALLFVNANETAILAQTQTFLRIVVLFFFPLCIVNVFRFSLQGLGYSGFAVFAGLFEMVGRAIAAFVLIPVFGFVGACFASPVAWVLADAFLIPALFNKVNRLNRLFKISTAKSGNPVDRKEKSGTAENQTGPVHVLSGARKKAAV